MKRFAVIPKKNEKSMIAKAKIEKRLINEGMILDEKNPELVITVGGDGTLLFAVQNYLDLLDKIKFVSIHTGTLGFYTDYTEDQIDECLDNILKGEVYEIFESNLLQIDIVGDTLETAYAMNEVRIESVLTTQNIDIYIDNEFFERVRGNGMCLSTQAGSTAYNRALQGAVVDNGLSVLQLCEIAGIQDKTHTSLRVPYIMKNTRKVSFLSDHFRNTFLCYDHLNRPITSDVKSIQCKLCEKSVKFVRFKRYSYLDRLRMLY